MHVVSLQDGSDVISGGGYGMASGGGYGVASDGGREPGARRGAANSGQRAATPRMVQDTATCIPLVRCVDTHTHTHKSHIDTQRMHLFSRMLTKPCAVANVRRGPGVHLA